MNLTDEVVDSAGWLLRRYRKRLVDLEEKGRNKMSYWIAIWGKTVRFAKAPDVFSAMKDAFGMEAEDISVRKITHPAKLSLKKKKEIIADMMREHQSRVAALPQGGDRLVLPGLQRTMGKPKPEEFLV